MPGRRSVNMCRMIYLGAVWHEVLGTQPQAPEPPGSGPSLGSGKLSGIHAPGSMHTPEEWDTPSGHRSATPLTSGELCLTHLPLLPHYDLWKVGPVEVGLGVEPQGTDRGFSICLALGQDPSLNPSHMSESLGAGRAKVGFLLEVGRHQGS